MSDPGSSPTDGHDRLAASSADSEMERSSALFLADIERLRELEVQKRAMAAGDPERPALARSIEDLVVVLLGRSGYQRRLADEDRQQSSDGTERHPSEALDDWREAERRLTEGRVLIQRALEDVERYQQEYGTAFAHQEAETG
jgi:hypothetical protein